MNTRTDKRNDLIVPCLKAGGSISLIYISFFIFWDAWNSVYAPIGLLLSITYCWQIKKTNPLRARTLFVLSLFLSQFYCCFHSGGISSPLIIWLLPVGLMTTQLLGSKISRYTFLFNITSFLILFYLEHSMDSFNEFTSDHAKYSLVLLSISSSIIFNKYINYYFIKSSEYYLDVLENQKEAIDHHALVTIIDKKGDLLYANDTFCSISGFERDDLIGRNQALLNSGNNSEALILKMLPFLDSGEIWKGEICHRAKNGNYFWLNASVIPIKDEKGGISRFISVMNDITQKKEADIMIKTSMDEINELSSAKDEFLAHMSHEIRTPLNGIIGITEELCQSKLNSQDMEYVEMISNSGNNLLHVIDEILDLSRDRAACVVHDITSTTDLREDYSILVVEDDIVNQKVIQLLLKKLHLQAEYVKNGLEAISALKLKSYEIVFMDMEMPKMGGVEATKFIRGHNLGKHPYIIALTANAFEDDRIKCLDAGMDGFLAKPVNINEIKNQLLKLQEKVA